MCIRDSLRSLAVDAAPRGSWLFRSLPGIAGCGHRIDATDRGLRVCEQTHIAGKTQHTPCRRPQQVRASV
eukprot:9019463-Prorocentrum_lima.AAC.1